MHPGQLCPSATVNISFQTKSANVRHGNPRQVAGWRLSLSLGKLREAQFPRERLSRHHKDRRDGSSYTTLSS